MSEETVESTPEVSQSSDSVSSDSFDMKGAVDSISSDLFGKKEPVEEPEDVNEPEPKKEPKAKKEPKESKKEAPKEKETVSEVEETETEKAQEENPDTIERPASWKKDMQPTWDSMTKEAKEYVIQREEQMKQGLVKDRDDAVLGRTMRDAIAPFSGLLKAQGIPEKQMVHNLLSAHHKLSTSSMAERKEAFTKLAQSYGIKFDGTGQSQEIDPIVNNLTNELNSIKSYLTTTQQEAQQAAKAKVVNEVDAFASEHPYFDDVENEIAIFLEGDKNMTLQQAYEKAIWANPLTRQKEMERLQQEQAKKAKAEAEKKAEEARKAKSVNVRTKDTGRSPTAPKGSMFDTLNDTYREIQQRNRS